MNWSYFNYIRHINRDTDTYVKVVFDELPNNAILTAIMVCEDPEMALRDKGVLPNDRTGKPGVWPVQVKAIRKEPVVPTN